MESNRNFLMDQYYKRKAVTFKPRHRFNGKQDFNSWKSSLLPELKAALGDPDLVIANAKRVLNAAWTKV